MPKRPIPHASNRPAGGYNNGPSSDELFKCLPRLSSDTISPGGLGEDTLRDTYWELPLQGNAVWYEERKIYLPKDDNENV